MSSRSGLTSPGEATTTRNGRSWLSMGWSYSLVERWALGEELVSGEYNSEVRGLAHPLKTEAAPPLRFCKGGRRSC